jgi:hypothetical protein
LVATAVGMPLARVPSGGYRKHLPWLETMGAFGVYSLAHGETTMATSDWGLCKDCQWWQIDPAATIGATTMGMCTEEDLQPFRLRVSGESGCNRYTPGEPARAVGSGAAPPTAKPQR